MACTAPCFVPCKWSRMHDLLTTAYVLTQGPVLNLESDTVQVKVEGESSLRVPLMRLDGTVLFGRVIVTTFLIQCCAAEGYGLVWLDRRGRLAARGAVRCAATCCGGTLSTRPSRIRARPGGSPGR